MASLLSWFGNEAKKVKKTVQRDVVNPVAHAAGNVERAAIAAPRAVNRDVIQPVAHVAAGVASPFAYLAKADIVNPTRQIAAQFSHNNTAMHNANIATNRNLGLGDNGTDFTGGLRKLAGNTAQIGLDVVAPGTSKLVDAGVTKVIPKVVPRVVPRVVSGSVTGAALGGPTNVASYIGSKQPLTKQGLKQTFIQGTEGGALLGGVTAAAPEIVHGAVKGAQKSAPVVRQAARTASGENVAHRALLANNAGYQELQKSLTRSAAAANKINREGGSKIALAQHQKNIADIQQQMYKMRRDASQIGSVNPDYSSLEGRGKSSTPKPSSATTETQASHASSSRGSVAPHTNAAIAPPEPPQTQLALASGGDMGKPPMSAIASPADTPSPNTPGFTGPQKTSTFSNKTVRNSDVVSNGIKQRLDSPQYTVQQEKANYTSSLARLKSDGQNAFVSKVEQALNNDTGKITRQEATDAITAAQMLDASGDKASLQRASNIYDKLSEHYTAAGQLTQSAAILSRRTPQGLLYDARRQLTRAGAKITPELDAQIRNLVKQSANAKGEEKDLVLAKLQKTISDNVPQSGISKLTSVWKAGLLSGVKTQQGNFLSNATFAGLKKIADLPASAADKGLSLATGKRTKIATLRGSVAGASEGARDGLYTLKTGIDKRDVKGGKYEAYGELNFKNPVINAIFGKTSNFVFRGMNAADQPFYFSAARNSLYDQASAAAKTQGLKGNAFRDFVNNSVDNPSAGMAERARQDAEKAVLGQSTEATRAISQLVDKIPGGHFVAPFTKVPTNFLGRAIDFTPAGVGKGVFKAIKDVKSGREFDQRALSEAIGEGATGTGIIALGATLADKGLLSGGYPSDDPKEQQRWKANGIQENSIKLGGKWYSLNYLGPLGILLNAGNQYHQSGGNVASAAGAAAGGVGQTLLDQSFLQGVSGLSNAIQNPTQYAKNYVNSQASSIVPAWVNDTANLTDKYQRQSDTPLQSAENRIPGLRETNNVKQDVYGNNLRQAGGQLNTLNALKPSNDLGKNNTALKEVNRLHSIDPNNPDLQVTPSSLKNTVTLAGIQVKLSDDQKYDLQRRIGQNTQSAWNKLIRTNQYKALSDTDKANALSKLRSDIMQATERQYASDNSLGGYSDANTTPIKSPSSSVSSILNGDLDITSYAKTNGTTSKTLLKGDRRGTALLDKLASLSTEDKTTWSTKQIDKSNEDLYSRAQQIRPSGLPDLPKTNSTLQAYATYLRVKASNPSEIKLNTAKKTMLSTAYKSQLSSSAQDLMGQYTIADKEAAINDGSISKDDLESAIGYDNAMISAGLYTTPKISNTIRKKFGYGSAPKSGSSSKSGSGGSSSKLAAARLRFQTSQAAPKLISVPGIKYSSRAVYKPPTLKKYTDNNSGSNIVKKSTISASHKR